MSVNLSSFSPQSSGGGGIFVLKCAENGKFKYTQGKTFSAPYGGIVYLHTNSSTFEIINIDGTTPALMGSFQNAEIYRSSVASAIAEYIIPFGSYCELHGESGNYDVEYALYKYELVQS